MSMLGTIPTRGWLSQSTSTALVVPIICLDPTLTWVAVLQRFGVDPARGLRPPMHTRTQRRHEQNGAGNIEAVSSPLRIALILEFIDIDTTVISTTDLQDMPVSM